MSVCVRLHVHSSIYMCVCVCVCVFMTADMHACVRAHACEHTHIRMPIEFSPVCIFACITEYRRKSKRTYQKQIRNDTDFNLVFTRKSTQSVCDVHILKYGYIYHMYMICIHLHIHLHIHIHMLLFVDIKSYLYTQRFIDLYIYRYIYTQIDTNIYMTILISSTNTHFHRQNCVMNPTIHTQTKTLKH